MAIELVSKDRQMSEMYEKTGTISLV